MTRIEGASERAEATGTGAVLGEAVTMPQTGLAEGQGEPLGPLLAAITEEAHRMLAATRQEIMADFGRRMAHARHHMPRAELAAAMRVLKDARRAALAAAAREAKAESCGRRRAAIEAKSGRGPQPRAGRSAAGNRSKSSGRRELSF